MRQALLALALLSALASVRAEAQMTVEEARREGRAMAQEARNDQSRVPGDEADAQIIPGYDRPALPTSALFDDPDRLIIEGTAATASNEGYRAVVDGERARPGFGAAEIKAATSRARAVETDPSTYLAGEQISSESGTCVPLPPTQGEAGFYEASCDIGAKVDEAEPLCRTPLVVEVARIDSWHYLCRTARMRRDGYRGPLCDAFDTERASGVCREIGRVRIGRDCLQGEWPNCTEPGDWVDEVTLSCSGEVPGQSGRRVSETRIVDERRDEAQCRTATAGLTCSLASEACVDAEPQTRAIGGLAVTRACWNWERRYACQGVSQATDCAALEANRACRFLRTDCLDDPQVGACKVSEQVYSCPAPGPSEEGGRQYICGDDVYCINGDCEPIVREASTEFKDALVALHAIGQAGAEFDPATFAVFSGDHESCHKPVFGLVNCCAGKSSGLLTAAAGGAALAGGPAAIAALATPFLTMFLCSPREMTLDIKDRMGFCHRLGSYCSKSVLGICTTKRTAYCCFESKLSRILQEQGRPQLGKPWNKPRTETCRGFTVDEFAGLDLSRMDFSEIYAEFVDAAKLPDEVQTLTDIQRKIDDYFALHGGG